LRGDKTFKVQLDGHNLLLFFKGEVQESPLGMEFVRWKR
jgi:hypothetical protein